MLAGFIAYSIADRPGITSGLIGGMLAMPLGSGFLGGIVAGFLAGYVTKVARTTYIKLPQNLAGLKPVLILPLLSTLVVGLVMIYVIGPPVTAVLDGLTAWLDGMQQSSAVVLGLILGAMMAFDMGGPVNKAAYTFAVGLLASKVPGPMAAVMAAGMTPPLGARAGDVPVPQPLRPRRAQRRQGGGGAGLLVHHRGGDPVRRQGPVAGDPGADGGLGGDRGDLDGVAGRELVPHGGIIDLFVPGAVKDPLGWPLALVVGTLVSTAVLFVTTRSYARAKAAPARPAVAAPAPA